MLDDDDAVALVDKRCVVHAREKETIIQRDPAFPRGAKADAACSIRAADRKGGHRNRA
jgi:hypothetical protein